MQPQYLRICVTTRCDLHCLYCRPAAVASEAPDAELTLDEISVLIDCAAAEGVRKIRITGGEPLLRGDLEQIIRAASITAGISKVSLTTNGMGLSGRAEGLKQAGLDRVNISLDTLQRERFRAMSGSDRHQDVLAGIEVARGLFCPVKLNVVLLRGLNDDEIEELVEFAASRGLWIRFIERYASRCVTAPSDGCMPVAEVRRRLRRAFGPLEPLPAAPLSIEQTYRLPQFGGAKVGLIASVTHPPCTRCSKLRVTASGELRACLYANWGISLAALLHHRDAQAVRAAIREAFSRKPRSRGRAGAFVPMPISHIGG